MAWKEKLRELPLVRGTEQIILQQGRRLLMENCKQVIFCDSEKIILRGGVQLEIRGDCLKLKELGNENMEVEGRIKCIFVGDQS